MRTKLPTESVDIVRSLYPIYGAKKCIEETGLTMLDIRNIIYKYKLKVIELSKTRILSESDIDKVKELYPLYGYKKCIVETGLNKLDIQKIVFKFKLKVFNRSKTKLDLLNYILPRSTLPPF